MLSTNVFRFPFLVDDYDFLGRAASLRLTDFLPADSVLFYRPLSREVYFWLITHVFGNSALAAHLLNLTLIAAITGLLIIFVEQHSGPGAGWSAGALFACSAAVPLCVGWISADQDLLCALFLLVAFQFAGSRRYLGATLGLTAAILSKETAVGMLPAVAGLAVFRAQSGARERLKALAPIAFIAAAWISIHPWTRSILHGGIHSSQGEHVYIGFFGSTLLSTLVTGLAMALNFPWLMQAPSWPSHLIPPAIIASGLVIALISWRRATAPAGPGRPGHHWLLCSLVGASVALISLVLTSLTLGRWAPHYTVLPVLGISMIVGPALARAPSRLAVAVLLSFLWLGIGLRGNSLAPGAPSEPNFGASAEALHRVERGFRALHSSLPASNVYVSVQTKGAGGLYGDLFRYQPLRVWYREPGIWVLDPNRRRASDRPEFLFWIGPDLSVFEISLRDLSPRGPTRSIDLFQYEKTLRGYSYGLAAAGDIDRATAILTHLPVVSEEVTAFDRRSAAMLLFAAGRDAEADRLVATTPAFPASAAPDAVVALLAEPVRGLDLDVAAMRAFGLDASDSSAVRSVMRGLDRGRYLLAASRFAQRLLQIEPRDAEATAVVERDRSARNQQVTAPIPYDIPQ